MKADFTAGWNLMNELRLAAPRFFHWHVAKVIGTPG